MFMQKSPREKYLLKAARLTRDEAQQFYLRMKRKLERSIEKHKVRPVVALALQLEIEDKNLNKWRERFSVIKSRSRKKQTESPSVKKPLSWTAVITNAKADRIVGREFQIEKQIPSDFRQQLTDDFALQLWGN